MVGRLLEHTRNRVESQVLLFLHKKLSWTGQCLPPMEASLLHTLTNTESYTGPDSPDSRLGRCPPPRH